MTLASITLQGVSPSEQEARVELASLYRLIEHKGWGEGIYNHVALRVPDEPDKFLIKRHALIYDEVTASNLVKVDCNLDLDEKAGVNKVGYTTHAPVMRNRPDLNCSIHIHTVPIMAISAHPKGLRMLHQHSTHFYDNVAYMDYGGFVENKEEQDIVTDKLGDKKVLFLRNHGALIVGKSAEDAFTSLIRLMYACEIQLTLEAAGEGMIELSPEVCVAAVEQFRHHDKGRGGADWPAWLRRIERIDPSYKN